MYRNMGLGNPEFNSPAPPDEEFGRLQFVHGIAPGLVTGGAGRLREGRALSHSRHPRLMESKKSALFFVPRSLSTRNSVASSSSMG